MNKGFVKIKKVMASVYGKPGQPKPGLLGFVEPLYRRWAIEFIASGGTCAEIKRAGIPAITVESVTGFPEMFGGRVKTIHPLITAPIIYNRGKAEDVAETKKHGIGRIDMVINTLYPFEETIAMADCTEDEAIEQIDVGGILLLRESGKNYSDVVVISDVSQYESVLAEMMSYDGGVSYETRLALAEQAFSVTATYDTAIHNYLVKLRQR